jgi:hypothetical protein
VTTPKDKRWRAWAERHDLKGSDMDLQCAYDDARTDPVSASVPSEPYGYLWFDAAMERRFTHRFPNAHDKAIGDVTPVYTKPPSHEQGRLQSAESILRMLVEAASHDKLEDFTRTSNVADMAADFLRGARSHVAPLDPIYHQQQAEELEYLAERGVMTMRVKNAMQEAARMLRDAAPANEQHINAAPQENTDNGSGRVSSGTASGSAGAAPSSTRSRLADELERLGAAATEGPWAWDQRGEKINEWALGVACRADEQPISGRFTDDDAIYVEQVCQTEGATVNYADPDLICALRNNLPEIIEALRARSAKEDSDESVGDWQCKDYGDGWITFPDRKAAERYQRDTGAMMRYRRYYPPSATTESGGTK